ncbi:MAG: hypothetical protein M0030_10200 [Actinomycetota bacterium]|jgi:hypothetical protein|nr:hypothetical protein [Actinomycetota bacterium]
MNARLRSYPVYGLGVGVVWAVILVLVSLFGRDERRRTTFLVFGGFASGWVSATIARSVYPPPRKYRKDSGAAS